MTTIERNKEMQISTKNRIVDNYTEIVGIEIGDFDSESWPTVVQSNEYVESMDIREFVNTIKMSLRYSEILIKVSSEQ